VVPCLPGARLTQPPAGDRLDGELSVKLGPITATFAGEGQIVRDEARRRGRIVGGGRDRQSASRAAGEVEYVVVAADDAAATRLEITLRAVLSGPLAQFGRGQIVEDLAARIIETFARNVEARLSGSPDAGAPAPLRAGALLRSVRLARLGAVVGRFFGGG